jgi:predicted DNA-binding mobile mystery protein A
MLHIGMNSNLTALARRQLSSKLEAWKNLAQERIPAKGWIRTLREALGLSGVALARRLGISLATLLAYERSEREGRVSLKTLRKTAEAMDCVLVYAIVPRTTLQDILRKRAEQVANGLMKRVGHSMKLEAQGVEDEEVRLQAEELVNQLLAHPRKLWK